MTITNNFRLKIRYYMCLNWIDSIKGKVSVNEVDDGFASWTK